MPINYKHYPEDWKEIRMRILDRDNQKCQHCLVTNYDIGYRDRDGYFNQVRFNLTAAAAKKVVAEMRAAGDTRKLITIILTVAHLDHDEWNHEVTDDRLVALCQRCHLAFDRVDNNNRKKYGKLYKKNQLEII